MFKEIYTFTVSDFLKEYPDAEVPDSVRSNPSHFVRVGVPCVSGPLALEFSDECDNWEFVK